MDVPSPELLLSESEIDTRPLLMERQENLTRSEHIIDIPRSVEASSVNASQDRVSSGLQASSSVDRPPSGSRMPSSQVVNSSTNGGVSRNTSVPRRGEGRRRRSPLNSTLWISVEFVLTVSQIIAAIVVLAISRNEHPHAPLLLWVVGYSSGCAATLPLLYWRFWHRNQGLEQDSAQQRQGSAQINAGPFSVSVSRAPDGGDRQTAVTASRNGHNTEPLYGRLKVVVEYFKMGLDCFFAVWFVVGNVWVFGGGNASSQEAPNMYRLCMVFLTFSCIGYAMPFILCATICCCLPCIVSILGLREDAQTRGATTESINALPTYKFKLNKSCNSNGRDNNSANGDGGIVAVGTEKERAISGEDAVCCICLARYAHNDELRELPCSHFFHKDCVDQWLKINASCPLCKSDISASVLH